MTQVHIEETPGGHLPEAKAAGHVVGYQTQAEDARAEVAKAEDKLTKVRAQAEEAITAAEANVAARQAEVAAADAAAEAAQADYAALTAEGKGA